MGVGFGKGCGTRVEEGGQLANILFSLAFLAAYLEMDDSPVLQENILILSVFFLLLLFVIFFFSPLFPFKINHFRRTRFHFCGQDFYVMAGPIVLPFVLCY